MDVVTFGETMVLFTPLTVGPLRYASQFEKTIGGAESNVAIALARLGHKAAWISRLGNDEFGLYVRNFIRGEGVDTSEVKFDEGHPTGIFFKERVTAQDPKVFYYRRGSAASFMVPEDLDEDFIAQAKFLHITGITPALSETCRDTVYHALRLAKQKGLTIIFDPNIRLKLWSEIEARRVLLDIASQCDIVLPGLEEGELLTGESNPQNIANVFLENGSKIVVIKLGSKGAFYATKDQTGTVEGLHVSHIVDTVGAGDGFAAGFISGLIRGWSLQESVRLGNQVAVFALTVPGDVEGYPYWNQIVSGGARQILR